MKLLCTLAPRTDGSVVFNEGRQRIVFAKSDAHDGMPVADVADDALVAKMLRFKHFEPADEADYEKADALMIAAGVDAGAADLDDEDDDGDGTELVNGGLPAEAGTPPKPARGPGKVLAGNRRRARSGVSMGG